MPFSLHYTGQTGTYRDLAGELFEIMPTKDNKKKILIIEDDPVMLHELNEVLHRYSDYNVTSSSQGEEGLTLIQSLRPDLILLDVMLPEIDGFEICRSIQNMPVDQRPKIILLTALTPLLDKMESDWLNQTGADGLLPKPLDTNRLLSMISESLRK